MGVCVCVRGGGGVLHLELSRFACVCVCVCVCVCWGRAYQYTGGVCQLPPCNALSVADFVLAARPRGKCGCQCRKRGPD